MTQDSHIQSLLIAEYRLTYETKEERKKRQQNANKARIKQRLEQLKRKEAFYGQND